MYSCWWWGISPKRSIKKKDDSCRLSPCPFVPFLNRQFIFINIAISITGFQNKISPKNDDCQFLMTKNCKWSRQNRKKLHVVSVTIFYVAAITWACSLKLTDLPIIEKRQQRLCEWKTERVKAIKSSQSFSLIFNPCISYILFWIYYYSSLWINHWYMYIYKYIWSNKKLKNAMV